MVETSCPFLYEMLYHKHPEHLTCMGTLALPAAKSWRSSEPKMHNQVLPTLIFSSVTVPVVLEASLDLRCLFITPSLIHPSLSCRKGTQNDWRNEHIKCLVPSSKRGLNSSLFHRTSWLCYQPSQQPFPDLDRLGVIDMWGMTNNYTCRTGWKLGREPTSLSQSTQCQMASSNSTHSRDTAPTLLRAGGEKKP